MKNLILKLIPGLMVLSILAIGLYASGVFADNPENLLWESLLSILLVGYGFTIFFSIGILLLEKGDPVKTLSWIVIMLALPGLGIILYSFLGASFKEERIMSDNEYVEKQLISNKKEVLEKCNLSEKVVANDLLKNQHRLIVHKNIKTALNNPRALLSQNNEVQVLVDGPATFEAIFRDLATAKHHIHLEYFIWTDDELGQKLKDLLIKKVQEKVVVRLLIDGLGSSALSNRYIHELLAAGIDVLEFRPVRLAILNSHSNFRNHRKIIIIDGHIGFTGGINVDGKYLAGDPHLGHWHDMHLRLEGDAVKGLQMNFLQDWAFLKGQQISDSQFFPKTKINNQNTVQIIGSGPDTEWDGIKQVYLNTLYTARDYVYMVTPYFIPNNSILNAMRTAAQSGVDIRLIIPAKGDSKIVQAATLSFAEEMLHCSVKVYQYQKGFIHSKLMIADDMIATIGTANMDIRSFDQNLEINAVLYDADTLKELKAQFEQDFKNSRELTLKDIKKRSFAFEVMQAGCRLLAPLL